MFGRTLKGAPKIIWCDGLNDYSQKRKQNQTPQSDEDSEKRDLMVLQHQRLRKQIEKKKERIKLAIH